MIFTSYYFKYELAKNDFSVLEKIGNIDKRFLIGKYFETFPLWYKYIRNSAPNEHIIMFDGKDSPIPIERGLKYVTEPYEVLGDSFDYNPNIKFHLKNASPEIVGECQFPTVNPITRDILDGLVFAYKTNNDFFRIDCDCFVNSNLEKYIKGYDLFSVNIGHKQFTTNVHFLFISKERLHAWDFLYDLPKFLKFCAYDGDSLIKQGTFFEGGLYKLFCYGNYNTSQNINVTHSTNYYNFLEFLKKNPLSIPEYVNLIKLLENVPKEVLNNSKLDFEDECFYEQNS